MNSWAEVETTQTTQQQADVRTMAGAALREATPPDGIARDGRQNAERLKRASGETDVRT